MRLLPDQNFEFRFGERTGDAIAFFADTSENVTLKEGRHTAVEKSLSQCLFEKPSTAEAIAECLAPPFTDAEAWIRIEDQVLYRLSQTRALLFGIRLVNVSLAELKKFPEAQVGLHRAITTMPEVQKRHPKCAGICWSCWASRKPLPSMPRRAAPFHRRDNPRAKPSLRQQ